MLGSTAAFRYISDQQIKRQLYPPSQRKQGPDQQQGAASKGLFSSEQELASIKLQVRMKVQHQSRFNCGKYYVDIFCGNQKYQWLLPIVLSWSLSYTQRTFAVVISRHRSPPNRPATWFLHKYPYLSLSSLLIPCFLLQGPRPSCQTLFRS